VTLLFPSSIHDGYCRRYLRVNLNHRLGDSRICGADVRQQVLDTVCRLARFQILSDSQLGADPAGNLIAAADDVRGAAMRAFPDAQTILEFVESDTPRLTAVA
jgi:hypothetical protein